MAEDQAKKLWNVWVQFWIRLWAHRPALARRCTAHIHQSATEAHGPPPHDLQADILVRWTHGIISTPAAP